MSLYQNEKFNDARRQIEELEIEQHYGQLEHLLKIQNETVAALIDNLDVEDGERVEMIVRWAVKNAMQEAISVREANASYKMQLIVPLGE